MVTFASLLRMTRQFYPLLDGSLRMLDLQVNLLAHLNIEILSSSSGM